jgi:hypothetical protein
MAMVRALHFAWSIARIRRRSRGAIVIGMGLRFLLVVAALLAADTLRAADRLSVRVSPLLSFAPATLVVHAMVTAAEENRAIEVVAESADFYRSSEVELDGERAPRTTRIELRSLPGGTYEVRAILKGPGGTELASVEREINVIDSGQADFR